MGPFKYHNFTLLITSPLITSSGSHMLNLREQIFSLFLWLIFLVLIVLWAEWPLRLLGNLWTILTTTLLRPLYTSTLANFGSWICIVCLKFALLREFAANRNFSICRKFAQRRDFQLGEAQNLRRSTNLRWSNWLVYTGLYEEYLDRSTKFIK